MAFLSTLSSGNYSPTLSIRAGVYPCQQELVPSSSAMWNYSINTNRIRGNYDYASKFECGYFNFESYNPVYNTLTTNPTELQLFSIDGTKSGLQKQYTAKDVFDRYVYATPNITNFWKTNPSTNNISRDMASNNAANFANAIVVSGVDYQSSSAIGGVFLNIPSSADLMAGARAHQAIGGIASGDITIYGRYSWHNNPDTPYYQVQFANLFSFGPNFQIFPQHGSGVSLNYTNTNSVNLLDGVLNCNFKKENSNTTVNGTNGILYNRTYFNSFLLTMDVNSTIRLYEGPYDGPLQLVNIQTNSTPIRYDCFFSGVTLYSHNQPFVWTDFGISNRCWTDLEISEFNATKSLYGPFISQDPYVNPPTPSGDDASFLNIHFPAFSSGNQSSNYSIDSHMFGVYFDSSSLTSNVFEFDRSDFNNQAIKLDLWVESLSTNPSGYFRADMSFPGWVTHEQTNRKAKWLGFPVFIPQNTKSLITMSGVLSDGGAFPPIGYPVNLCDATLSKLANPILYFGGNYEDIGVPYSGDINIYSARMYLDAWCTPPSTGNSVTLYTSGNQRRTERLDLYIQNSTVADGTDLYIYGNDSLNSSADLFIAGGFAFNSTSLFLNGLDRHNDNITLYMDGGFQKANMPLYVYSAPPSELTGDIPLSMWATTHSGSAGNVSLFIGENAPNGEKNAGMNLYVYGPNSQRVTAGMNLFLRRDYYRETSSVTMYCCNEYTQTSGNITLYMAAPSGTLGAIPVSASMNLFISRDTDAIEQATTLFTSGPGSSNNSADMYVNGGPDAYNSIPMVTDGVGVLNADILKLYINGF